MTIGSFGGWEGGGRRRVEKQIGARATLLKGEGDRRGRAREIGGESKLLPV